MKSVVEAIQAAKPESKVVTPTSAALAAFEHLGINRVSLLTPYLPEVTQAMGEYFATQGLEIVNAACMGIADDRDMARVATRSVVDFARRTVSDEAEGIFISCTALRAAEVAATIEAETGKPVVTSNQAQVWHCLRAIGCTKKIQGYGTLLSQ